jgi:hypothetical protein
MHSSAPSPALEDFIAHARAGYNAIPIARRFSFDTQTAVTAYANLFEPPFGFLLESVVGAEKWARYTFLGSAPREVIRARADGVERWTKTKAGTRFKPIAIRWAICRTDWEPSVSRPSRGSHGFSAAS